jgi:succinate dehydrogenase / fumarate reductase cytochrome b subunit
MSWLLKSSIGRKFIMALSGCCMVLFLLFHMSMNLVLVFSAEAYDMICEFLGTNWYAIVGTMGLAALFIVHIIYAILLTLQNRKARGADSYASSSLSDATWSSKNMFVLGVVILAFLCLHLYDFWYKMQFSELLHLPGAESRGSVIALALFKNPVHVILYLIGIAAVWVHLSHGVWSMFQTTGLNGRTWAPRLKVIGYVVATIIAVGFAIVPIYCLARAYLCPFA